MYKIYIVEDDQKIANILAEHLEKYGYQPMIAKALDNIKVEFLQINPDLVLLDINLPYYDGFYWCRQIRTVSNLPIIFVSARDSEMNQVLAIEHGGDDYIIKPFHLDVVVAKVKGVLRRTYGEYAMNNLQEGDVQELAGLFIHRNKLEIEYGGRSVILSPKEFRLLDILVRKVDQVVSRDELLEALWDEVEFVDDNTLTVNVTRVRKRLAELGIEDAIATIRGQGYRLSANWGPDAQ